jgi:YegS/Rv2252/BmrU family lipid kinase
MSSSPGRPGDPPAELPPAGRRAVLVVNGRSRSGREAAAEASRRLRAAGLDLTDEHVVADPRRIPDVVADAVDAGAGLVVLGGGDGTVSACAGVLAGRDVVLGLLPTGTANDFARTLAIPSRLDEACATVVGGRVVDVDLGTVGEGAARHHVVNVASMGLSVELTRALSPVLKRRIGAAAYPVAAVRAYRRHRPFRARLEFPDGDHATVEAGDLLQVAVANGRHYGGGNVVAPDAGLDDHMLDVYAVPRGTARQRLDVARGWANGTFVERDHVVHVRTRAVRVVTDDPMPVNIDGEIVTTTPQTFGIHRNALLVVVPPGTDAARLDGPRPHRRRR